MKVHFNGFILMIFVISGCQANIEEVVNEHNNIKNLEGLNKFVEDVNNQKEAKINYVQYGIEGQRGVNTFIFDGKQLNVSFRVDGKYIEEYNCEGIKIESKNDTKRYVLSQCKGDFEGARDFQILSISGKDK